MSCTSKCGNISVCGKEVKMKYFGLQITEFMDCCFRYSYKIFCEWLERVLLVFI